MDVDEAVVDLAVERGRAVLARPPTPPEPVAVHLVISAEEDGDVGIAELREVSGDNIDLGAPAVVEIGAGRKNLMPFVVSEVTLHAVVKSDGLVIGGADGMPRKGDDRAMGVLAFDLRDHSGPRFDGIFVVAGGEAEVLTEERGIFSGEVVGAIGPAGNVVGEVVLAGERGASGS